MTSAFGILGRKSKLLMEEGGIDETLVGESAKEKDIGPRSLSRSLLL